MRHERTELDKAARHARQKLILACVFSILFMIAEVIGGFLAGSLAIMTDAAHLLSDVAGFLISLFAIWIGQFPASSRMSYGFQRAEVIGAIVSVLVIWVLTGVLIYVATQRLIEDLQPNAEEKVNGKIMFITACLGLLTNLALMSILGHGHGHGGKHHHNHGDSMDSHCGEHLENTSQASNIQEHSPTVLEEEEKYDSAADNAELGEGDCDYASIEADPRKRAARKKSLTRLRYHNINVYAAYIHALGDLLQSIGVCIAGAIVWYRPKWQIADPIATYVFSILVLFTTIDIIKSSVHVLMEGTPEGINPLEIEEGLRKIPGVLTTHDLHIWSLTVGLPSLSVHVVAHNPDTVLEGAQHYLMLKGITHSTIQVEHAKKVYPRDCNLIKCRRLE